MASQVQQIILSTPAAVVTAVTTQQTPLANVAFTINGTLASGGVASLTTARRVTVVSAGNDSATTFSITGTDRNGNVFTETILGANIGTVTTIHDFLTVTRVSASVQPAGAGASIGTSATGSSTAIILDAYPTPSNIGITLKFTGTVTFNIEGSNEDYSSTGWDLNNATPTWISPVAYLGFALASLTALTQGSTPNVLIIQPLTMLRLTVTSGTGTVQASIQKSIGFARF